MKNIIYIEENFITPDECNKFIDLSKSNKKELPYGSPSRGGDTYLTTVEWKNQGASYYGGNVDTVVPSLDEDVYCFTCSFARTVAHSGHQFTGAFL